MIGHIGVIVALILLIFLALRGMNVLLASLLAATVVAVTNALPLAEALSTDYAGAMFKFAQMFFLLFLAGAIFGRVMGESRAAMSIARAMTHLLGEDRTLLVIVLANALLTYGGVNVFIVVFTMYPLGLGLLQRANLPKRLFAAAGCLGGGTFTMTAMPGSPSLHNNIPMATLDTTLSAGWGLGLIASAIMLGLGLIYLEYERRKAKRHGEVFEPHPLDPLPEEGLDAVDMPHWFRAFVPIAAVIGTILIPQWMGHFTGKVGDAQSAPGVLMGLLRYSQEHPLFWTSIALAIGTAVALVLFWKHLASPGRALSQGAESAAMPLLNTAAVIGFGGVVNATPIFDAFKHVMVDSTLNPIISMVVAVNVFAGIVGSASGGLGIFMQNMAPFYLEAGVSPDTMHRLAAIASGGLDSLPHSGAVITFLTVMRLTHREAYKGIAVVTVIIPVIALAAVVLIAMAVAR
ncbi:MAG: GntP family permease [FCB group bacterium]|jgi:H+/gluconate symporter-like permease|nr:GntP family permease [FCB group bacterium]